MSFDKNQFKDLIKRVLTEVDPALCSDAAVNLLLGTAAQESRFGQYLRQLGGGPAVGVFQMEPATFIWLRDHFEIKYPYIKERRVEELEWNLRLAILMARLRYRIVPAPLPKADVVLSLAAYWKTYYNTVQGKGTVEEFERNYRRFLN